MHGDPRTERLARRYRRWPLAYPRGLSPRTRSGNSRDAARRGRLRPVPAGCPRGRAAPRAWPRPTRRRVRAPGVRCRGVRRRARRAERHRARLLAGLAGRGPAGARRDHHDRRGAHGPADPVREEGRLPTTPCTAAPASGPAGPASTAPCPRTRASRNPPPRSKTTCAHRAGTTFTPRSTDTVRTRDLRGRAAGHPVSRADPGHPRRLRLAESGNRAHAHHNLGVAAMPAHACPELG